MTGVAVETRRIEPRRPRRRLDVQSAAALKTNAASDMDFQGAVIACAGDLSRAQSKAAIFAGRKLADDAGVALICLTSPDAPATGLADFGVDALCRFGDDFALAASTSAFDLSVLLERFSPIHLVFPDEVPGAGVLGRSMAASLGIDPNVGVVEIERGQVVCAAASPRLERREAVSRILLVDLRFPAPLRLRRRPMRHLASLSLKIKTQVEDLGLREARSADLPVGEAAFVLGGGAGVTDWPLFSTVAGLLGAAAGASRVVVDAGYMPRDRQIGASGTTTGAELYVALGISGAVQHLEGIAGCRRVISINLDAQCAMAARADVAIQADCQAVLGALLAQLQERAR